MNAIDLMAIIPYFVTLVTIFNKVPDLVVVGGVAVESEAPGASLAVLRVIRLVSLPTCGSRSEFLLLMFFFFLVPG